MQLDVSFLFINLGVPELSIIVLLVLILFGPGKLPGVMKALGDGVKQFKDGASGIAGENKAAGKGTSADSKGAVAESKDAVAESKNVSEQPEHKPE